MKFKIGDKVVVARSGRSARSILRLGYVGYVTGVQTLMVSGNEILGICVSVDESGYWEEELELFSPFEVENV